MLALFSKRSARYWIVLLVIDIFTHGLVLFHAYFQHLDVIFFHVKRVVNFYLTLLHESERS